MSFRGQKRRSRRLQDQSHVATPRFGRPSKRLRFRPVHAGGDGSDSDLELSDIAVEDPIESDWESDPEPAQDDDWELGGYAQDPDDDSDVDSEVCGLTEGQCVEASDDDSDIAGEEAVELPSDDEPAHGHRGRLFDQISAQCAYGRSIQLRVGDFVHLLQGTLLSVMPWLPSDLEAVVRIEEILSCNGYEVCVVTLCLQASAIEALGWPSLRPLPVVEKELIVCHDCHATVSLDNVLDTVGVSVCAPTPGLSLDRDLLCYRALRVDLDTGAPQGRGTELLREALRANQKAPDADSTERLILNAIERYGLPAENNLEDGFLVGASEEPLIKLLRNHGADNCLHFGTAADSTEAMRRLGVTEGLPLIPRGGAVSVRQCEACNRKRPCRLYLTASGRVKWIGRNCGYKLRAAADLESCLRWLAVHPQRTRAHAAAAELRARLDVCRASLYY